MSEGDYCKYYEAQRGGELPVFRGGTQSGAGLGDILRGIFRFLMPVALRGIQTFAGNTLAATQAGVPLPLAAKTAIMPTISAVAGSAAPTISRLVNAVLPGIIPSSNTTTDAAGQSGSGVLFDGENGIPTTPKARSQYKRAASATADTSAKRGRKAHTSEIGVHYNF
jgi:hypothetical protein